MKRPILTIMLSVCMLGVAGCFAHYHVPRRGIPVTQEELDKIIRGVSTKQEVLAILGKPSHKSVGNALSSLWQYDYSLEGKSEVLLDGKTAYRHWTNVVIEFTFEGVVKDYFITKSEEKLDKQDKEGVKHMLHL